MLSIGGLVALSAGAVLAVSTYANFRNTTELLNTSAAKSVETIEASVFSMTAPISDLAVTLQKSAETGTVDLSDKGFLQAFFKGVSASVPHLTDLDVIYPDGSLFKVRRVPGVEGFLG